eukprot:1131641-Rhodomonas_salina.1
MRCHRRSGRWRCTTSTCVCGSCCGCVRSRGRPATRRCARARRNSRSPKRGAAGIRVVAENKRVIPCFYLYVGLSAHGNRHHGALCCSLSTCSGRRYRMDSPVGAYTQRAADVA